MTNRDQATLPEHDAESEEPEFHGVEKTPVDEPGDDVDAQAGGAESSRDPEPEPETLERAAATGAYVLGALSPQDAAATAKEIASSRAMQAEIAALLPVADILMSLYQTQSTPAAPAAAVIAPSGDRAFAQPVPDRPVTPPRRQTTVRPVMPGLGALPASTILIGLLALAAAIGVLWALALNDRIATRDDEIAALKRQVAQLRQAANASAFVLSPTDEGPDDAHGAVFYSLADSTVLIDVSGMPELDEGRVYQVWFQRTGGEEWLPGPTFLVNQQGDSVQRLPGQTPTFTGIAVSEEPAPGSQEPTGPLLLQGAMAGGNG